jgi:hypothetical protein
MTHNTIDSSDGARNIFPALIFFGVNPGSRLLSQVSGLMFIISLLLWI